MRLREQVVRFFCRPKRLVALSLFVATTLVVAAYVYTVGQLGEAKQARRDDNNSAAERLLATCWRLPGLNQAIELEEQLSAVQQGDLRGIETWQSRARSNSPDSRLILESLAKGHLATFQWLDAEKYAESILDRLPTDARALWLRGRARVEMQRENQARNDFENALQTEPSALVIRRSLANLLHSLGYVHEAVEHYRVLVEQWPGDERGILSLARCLQDLTRNNEARELVDLLLAKHPDSVSALVERSRIALRLKTAADAERWLRRALELSPDHAEANFVLRLALQSQQKNDAALDQRIDHNDRLQAELKSRLLESQHQPVLLTDVGQWMLRTGKMDEAAGWFYSALKADSDFAPAHLGLADLFLLDGQKRRAKLHASLGRGELKQAAKRPDASEESEHDIRQLLSGALSTLPGKAEEASPEGVRRLCAACHAYPTPESMPRSAWRKKVKQGFDFLRDSALADDFPSLESVVNYYERRAPERFSAIGQSSPRTDQTPIKFEKRGTGFMPHVPPHPAVANANLAKLFGGRNQELILCETRLNAMLVLKPYAQGPGGIVLPQLTAPCHTSVCDLDLDGRTDILVASLGNFFPTDDKVGKVYWLQGGSGGQFVAKTILEGVGRVADVQTADCNGDGRLDLIVAAFGWRTTGEILYLENRTTDWSQPQFTVHVVDSRHGAIHVPIADLNHDGRPDFVGLISQHHETVVAYLNQGDGKFKPATIFAAEFPSFGCSGIELVDLDSDHDMDVLLTNGDILDRPYLLKPYHGVQWLENEGKFPYKQHRLATMYGVSRAVSADFDGDGDRDLAAVSFLPAVHFPERENLRLPSVVLFEQTAKSQFNMHILETQTCDHLSCAAGDWDDDGRIDLAVANFCWDESQSNKDAAVLWRNVSAQPVVPKH